MDVFKFKSYLFTFASNISLFVEQETTHPCKIRATEYIVFYCGARLDSIGCSRRQWCAPRAQIADGRLKRAAHNMLFGGRRAVTSSYRRPVKR
jgi:hypothetical protein